MRVTFRIDTDASFNKAADARPLVRRLTRRLGRRLGSDLLMVVLSHRGGGAESRMLAALSAAAPGVAAPSASMKAPTDPKRSDGSVAVAIAIASDTWRGTAASVSAGTGR